MMARRIVFLAFVLSSFYSYSQQHVLLLINEEEKEMVVLKKKQIRDILTLNFNYAGEAQLITEDGIYANYHKYPLDSIHSLVVKHGNLKANLGWPLKAIGLVLGAAGGLLIWSSTSVDDNATEDESTDALGRLALGVGTAGLGTGFFFLGRKIGNRPVEKEQTTYYLSQWDARIVEISSVESFRRAVKN